MCSIPSSSTPTGRTYSGGILQPRLPAGLFALSRGSQLIIHGFSFARPLGGFPVALSNPSSGPYSKTVVSRSRVPPVGGCSRQSSAGLQSTSAFERRSRSTGPGRLSRHYEPTSPPDLTQDVDQIASLESPFFPEVCYEP